MEVSHKPFVRGDSDEFFARLLASPREAGKLEAIFIRPTTNRREAVAEVRLTVDGGIEGDRWLTDSYYRLPNGSSDPRCQVSLMNVRLLQQISATPAAMSLAGNNLIVDLDLSDENLPIGAQLAIGVEAIIELTNLPHTGCGKFAKRYGNTIRSFVNDKHHKSLHLRGRYARVIRGGTVRVGNTISKLPEQRVLAKS